jgi:parallel beta-helix repeat protein
MASCVKRITAVASAVAAVLMGTLMLAAGPASATAFACGSTITESVVLTQDVDCRNAPGVNALTIGAPGVTLDMNGYQILGPATGSNASGIISPYGDLTVENGTISNFTQDVQFSGSSGLQLRDLNIISTVGGFGVHVIGPSSNDLIQNLFVDGLGRGIWLDHCQGCTVSANTLNNIGNTALWDEGGSGNTWSFNRVRNAGTAGILAQGTTNAVIDSNGVSGGPAAYGVDNESATGSRITTNILNDLKVAVFDNASTSSTVMTNVGFGDTVGLQVTGSIRGVYSDNFFVP